MILVALRNQCLLDFESQYDITFPKKYKKLIMNHNGLQFIKNTFTYLNEVGLKDASSFAFCAFGNVVGSDCIDNSQDFDTYGYERLITFGLSGAGDYICFDYRFLSNNIDSPSIIIMIHDEYIEDDLGKMKMKIFKIANSFEEFMDTLHE